MASTKLPKAGQTITRDADCLWATKDTTYRVTEVNRVGVYLESDKGNTSVKCFRFTRCGLTFKVVG